MNRKTALRKLRRIVGLPKHQWKVCARRCAFGKVRLALEKKTHSQSGSRKIVLEVTGNTYAETLQQFERRFDQ